MSAPTPNNELLRLAIGHANEKAPVLIGRLCDACVSGLTDNTKSTKAFTHGRLIGEALEQILRKRAVIVEAFPRHLQSFVTGAKTLERAGSGLTSLAKISFSKLELMDEGQVQESVEVARLQQNATSAVEAVMPELDALICGALGLRTVSHERNPMRVEIFVGALQAALVEERSLLALPLPESAESRWIYHSLSGL